MLRKTVSLAVLCCFLGVTAFCSAGYLDECSGQRLASSSEEVGLWWASSGWKIGVDRSLPEARGEAIVIRCARNEAEAAQLVVRPKAELKDFTVKAGALLSPGGGRIGSDNVKILEVRFVNVTVPTDKTSVKGLWPDPLPPIKGAMDLKAGMNQAFWVRIKAPRDVAPGWYSGLILLKADGYEASVPLKVEVYDFVLPDRMTCTTALGLSVGNVFRYQGISDEKQKREVLDKYFANFSEHHISPYDPTPLDGIKVTWPDIRPPERKWEGGVEVKNEKHSGQRSLLVYDDRADSTVTAMYKEPVRIPKSGLRLRFWYRTAVPDHQFIVTLTHYDESDKWIYGGNNDIGFGGNGQWQLYDQVIDKFPKKAKSVQLHLRGSLWTEDGDNIGLVWFDDVSLSDAGTGKELVDGGDFEPADLPEIDMEKLKVKFDFSAWDRAMERGIDYYKFNSFRLGMPGLGGGSFHARVDPHLLGFSEDTYIYKAIFSSYCGQLQQHLREKGWLDEAYIYWFDEPAPKDYEFVNNGFAKLKAAAPDINRMLTEQVEPRLIGGPNIWCPVTPNYKHEPAEQRRERGDKFWWYVCTGPKAPYCTLFIDHPGTELRVWLWQTWKYKIEGILVWETNYWTSTAAYPDGKNPQNPYADPMGWVSGYSTPAGVKRPWGNGDGRFIYPPLAAADAHPDAPVLDGPVDSIRWEMLRDGIEDYEYLVILRGLLEEKKAKLSAGRYEELSGLLEVPETITGDMITFTKDPAAIERHRDKVARAIVSVSKL